MDQTTTRAPEDGQQPVRPPARDSRTADMSIWPPSVPVLVSLFIASWIALAEVTRLSEQLVDAQARATSLTDLVGFSRLPDLFSWTFVDQEPYHRLRESALLAVDGRFRAWLAVYAVVDVVAVLCLAVLADRLLAYQPPGDSTEHRRRWLPKTMVGLRAATDLGLVLLALWPTADVLSVAVRLLAGLSWLALVIVAVAVVHRLVWGVTGTTPTWREQQRQLLQALYVQRFSLTVVVVIGAVVSLPGGEVLDQFPDAVRAWLDDWGTGGLHALLANVALWVLAVVVLVLGRMRSTRIFGGVRREPVEGQPSREPKRETETRETWWRTYGWWLIPPGFAVLLAALAALSHRGDVDWARLAWFVVPLLVLLGVSSALRRLKGHGEPIPVPDAEPLTDSYARLVQRVGDVLAGAVLVIGGLGLVRAMTAPALLGAGPGHVGVLAAGFVMVVVAWPLTGWVLTRTERWSYRREGSRLKSLGQLLRPDQPDSIGAGPSFVLAVLAVVTLTVLALFPLHAAAWLGVVGLVVVALTCLVTLAALAVLQSQDRNTLDLFALLRMRRNPVLTLFLVVPLAASLQSGDPDVHRVRQVQPPTTATAAQRPDLQTAFGAWLNAKPGCVTKAAPGGHPVRPLVLVAAAGGGIRAALWTDLGLEQLTKLCGSTPVFLSSGVSGGSVGLALARGSGYVDKALSLARPAPLAATLDGLLVRDLLAGALGIRVHDAEGDAGDGAAGRWLDRAGLLERSWERRAKDFDAPFLPGGTGAPGHLVLNSTSVGTACRVLISDLDLDGRPAAQRPSRAPGDVPSDPDCRTPQGGLPAITFDLLDTYQQCIGTLRTSTAALLSARFPYVTPSGVVSGCPGLTTQQLVDGGYAESDALGTLVDLAPQLVQLVRRHNAEVLDGKDDTVPLVVPTVVFLQNHFGTDVVPRPSNTSSEILVPPTARRAEKEQQQSGAFRQRLVALLGDPCENGCRQDRQSVPTFVTVAPTTEPQVSAPLGWTLSQASIEALQRAMNEQANPCRAAPSDSESARLCSLVAAVRAGGG